MFARSLLTVFALGLSVEGLALCPFVSMGLAMVDRAAGLRFLGGRLLGIMVFGLLVCWAGAYLHFDSRYVNLVFGLMLIALGTWRFFKQASHHSMQRAGRGTCAGAHGCPDRRGHRHAFTLGFARGLLNPGRKYVYLAPLLIGAGVVQGLVTSLIFGLSSSTYLLLGIFAAGALHKLSVARRRLEKGGALLLIVIGSTFSFKAVTQLSGLSRHTSSVAPCRGESRTATQGSAVRRTLGRPS